MNRLTDIIVFTGFVIACLLAGSPTFLSPFLRKATTDGVVLRPSSLGMTTGSLPSITATQLLVVPRSIPIIFPITFEFQFYNLLMLFNHHATRLKMQKWQFYDRCYYHYC